MSYVLCAVGTIGHSRYWRCILRIGRHGLSLCTTDPFPVRRILHEPDVTTVMLEVERKDTPLSNIPGLPSQCNTGAIIHTLLGEIVGIQ
jgi:hypothetical protein